jgi:hypothetical protein
MDYDDIVRYNLVFACIFFFITLVLVIGGVMSLRKKEEYPEYKSKDECDDAVKKIVPAKKGDICPFWNDSQCISGTFDDNSKCESKRNIIPIILLILGGVSFLIFLGLVINIFRLRPLEEEERRERMQKMIMVETQANRQRLLDLRNNKTESGGVPFYNREQLIRQLRNSGVRV